MKQFFAALWLLAISGVNAAQVRTFITWEPWQADSVLVAWVLKRHVFSDAQFEASSRGTVIAPDRALDTPDSPYRRSGTRTAFDESLRLNNIRTECTERLKPIIRTLELANWRKSEHPEAEEFELGLQALLPKTPAKGGLDAAFDYVDRFCAKGRR